MYLGEILRRVALALTVALVVTRAYWYAEVHDEAESGIGLLWTLCLVVSFAIAATSAWLAGGLRLRRSWADLAVLALIGLVALSARWADERRVAINQAWDWVGVGLAYFLVRSLPRTRDESSAIAGALVATAVALAACGLYQVQVEHPQLRTFYTTHKPEALKKAGVDASDPRAILRFEDRLIGSREPTATFALANTLAGFLVGPAAIGLALFLRNLRQARPGGDRLAPLLLAIPPLLVLLACLLLTKSRSAYIGLGVALVIFAYRERGRISRKSIGLAGAGFLAVVALLVAAASFAGQLDWKVLSESSKSLAYRLEYWRATWAMICNRPRTWWAGVGPGNFGGPYLQYKLPQASEEIADPHNMLLEVWTTAGLYAMIALVAALAWGFREAFGPSQLIAPEKPDPLDPPPPRSASWLVVSAGLGGWILVVALGRINPFEGYRWLVIGIGWLFAGLMGLSLWRRLPLTGDLLGLGVVAISVNLLAAGGIGFAPVALMLWGLLALALNLRDDRRCSRDRRVGGRLLAFFPMAAAAAMLGTFLGTAVPFWNASTWIAEGDELASQRVVDYEAADRAYANATRVDRLGSRGLIARANLRFAEWLAKGRPPTDLLAWSQINSALVTAAKRPRNPFALGVQRMRARMAAQFLAQPEMDPSRRHTIRIDRLDACAKSVAFYPNNALIRADYAEILGDLNQPAKAAAQAARALELDRMMPHPDKQLDDALREMLIRDLESWASQL